MRRVVVYGTQAGVGGLGLQAATAVAGLAAGGPVVALGPGCARNWPLETLRPEVIWEESPPLRPSWFNSHVVRRFRPGRFVLNHDREVGRWAASRLAALQPGLVYAFTQVGLEALKWAKANGVRTMVDNPNGHIRGFAEVYQTEWARWVGGRFRGHPTDEMIARVEREYVLADLIRVSSDWAKRSMLSRGVPEKKVVVSPQPINRTRFFPEGIAPLSGGPLRICYVGTLDVRKGFVYLLRALRRVGADRVRLEIVGGTGDRGSRWLFARERAGLNVAVAAGNPIPAYHRAELFVLPSLEDGFGFVAAEAMACGVPVVVTDQCGAAEWVATGETGWVVPAGNVDALADVLETAILRRSDLAEMGRHARLMIEGRDTMFARLALNEL
jgi:glycosyltransferase involved in cell wall biosynthesis